jgi:peptide/nickel transport system substrate-binding protein
LAESWAITQNSKVYLIPEASLSPPVSLDLAKKLSAAISDMSAEGRHWINIVLNTAGRDFEKTVLAVIPVEKIIPINLLHVSVNTEAPFKGQKNATAQAVLAELKDSLKGSPSQAEGVLEYIVDSSAAFEVKCLGDPAALTKTIAQLGEKYATALEKGKPRQPLCAVLKTDTRLFDNEPVIAFKLRKDVRWHDGKPFTSADVKFTYDRIMDEHTNTVRRPNFELVKSVETPDPFTVRVTYKEPFSPCLESWASGIIPKHLLEKEDINTAAFNRKPIGTGPFKFLEWKTDERITVLANENYFRGRPALDRISMRIIPEPELRSQEFMIEGVDFDDVEPHTFARFERDKRFRVYVRPANSYNYIGWNQKEEIFRDKRVRRALCYAINREEMVKYLMYGLGVVANGVYPPHMWYYNPNVKPLEYDPKRARQLLAEAGWRDENGDGILEKNGKPFKFDLMTNNGNPIRSDIAVLVQRQLKQVGIQVNIYLYEWSVFIRDKIETRNYEACVLGWGLSLDPDCYEIWHSSQIPKGFNFVGYKNPEVDRLIEEGRTEFDREKRKAIYQKMSALIYDDQPYTFLFFPEATPSLHTGAFKIKKPEPDGKYKVEDIRMTKAGLMYYLDRWFRVGGAVMQQ